MDSSAPGLWARRVALGASGWSEGMDVRRRATVSVEVREPEAEAGEVERLRGTGEVPTEERQELSGAAAVPDGTTQGERRGGLAPPESARPRAAAVPASDEAARRVGTMASNEGGWVIEAGTRVQTAVGAIRRRREAPDLGGLVETAEERRARVEMCR